MRAVFGTIIGFFALVALLSLVKTVSLVMTATVVPDQRLVIRWLCAGVTFAFLTVFWEVTRRRYVRTGNLRADATSAVLGGAGVAALVVMMIVFAITD